jgi:uncharacterized repeat protein (TIGR03803 family)
MFNFKISSIQRRLGLLLSVCLLVMTTTINAQTPPMYTDLHDFGGQTLNWINGKIGQDGNAPQSGVTIDSNGNMFGVTTIGGPNASLTGLNNYDYYGYPGYGLIYEITNTGVYRDIHDFGHTTIHPGGSLGPDGTSPSAQVVLDSEGNLYGSATQGGLYPNGDTRWGGAGAGVVWELTRSGTYKVLHDFGGTVTHPGGSPGLDGDKPTSIALDGSGNLFGITQYGGATVYKEGVFWEITHSGNYLVLHDFGTTFRSPSGATLSDGQSPSSLFVDQAGNAYGTTHYGGSNFVSDDTGFEQSAGTVWEYSAGGVYNVLHNFGGMIPNSSGGSKQDGAFPDNGIAFDSAGNLYGTTEQGGPLEAGVGNNGMVWEITKAGAYADLHDFGGTVVSASGLLGPDGSQPFAGVTIDSSGNLYGTTQYGGLGENGMVWEITAGGVFEDLHDFGAGPATNSQGSAGLDGLLPITQVTIDRFGDLFGTTTEGGQLFPQLATYDLGGIVWRIGSNLSYVAVGPSSVAAGTSSTGTVFLKASAPASGLVVKLSSSNPKVTVPVSVKVPSGAMSATFPIGTSGVTSATSAVITAKQGVAYSSSLKVVTVSLNGMEFFPSTVEGGSSTFGVVYLKAPAPVGGVTVSLSSGSSYVHVPATVFVGAGSSDVVFLATTNKVKTSTKSLVSATLAGVKLTSSLTLTP